MNVYKTGDVWWCPACKPNGAEGPFPDGGGPADWPRHCGGGLGYGCGRFLESPLTAKGIAETRAFLARADLDHVCPPEFAEALRALYRDVL